jgi:lipopolysaccharide/colanic/teichoic acid biosynthesis glycosyltransferase
MDNSSIAVPSPAQVVPSSGAPSRYAMVKRILDMVLALVLLTIFAPILVAAAVLVRLTSPGPILFRQTRIGLGGRTFRMLKLRTMFIDADDRIHREMNVRELLGDRAPPGTSGGFFRLEHDPRITRIGRWLRRYGIDELPQLFNVLSGEMSLVGPRPSLPWEVEMYTPEQCRRHECLPGITGLWQVSDRYSLSMPEMLALDLHYTDTRSLKLDMQILLRTPRAVLFDRSAR